MESEFTNGKMEKFTLENTTLIRNMALVSIVFRMVEPMKAGGLMASSMD